MKVNAVCGYVARMLFDFAFNKSHRPNLIARKCGGLQTQACFGCETWFAVERFVAAMSRNSVFERRSESSVFKRSPASEKCWID